MSELRGPLQHCARPCFGCAPVMRDGWKTIYTAYNSQMICTAARFGHKALADTRRSASTELSTYLSSWPTAYALALGSACSCIVFIYLKKK